MKKILSFLIVIALAMTLLLPALAAQPQSVDPNTPIITQQPSVGTRFRRSIPVRSGEAITLTIAAQLPPDAQGELSIAWFLSGARQPFAIGEQAVVSPRTRLHYQTIDIYAVVTNTFDDGETASVRSETITIIIYLPYFDMLRMLWGPITVTPILIWPLFILSATATTVWYSIYWTFLGIRRFIIHR